MQRRIVLQLLFAVWCGGPLFTAAACADEEHRTVKLTIDYGDGVQKVFTAIPWDDKLTALAALEAAARHERGIKFQHKGKGATTFVFAIDELKNEGSGSNWIFEVNGKLADKSCGIFALQPGDAVLWRFGKYR